MDLARTIINSGHALRSQANLKVRQPLSKAEIAIPQKEKQEQLKDLLPVIKDELNVKNVVLIDSADEYVTKTVKPNSKKLGPTLGHKMKEIIQASRSNQFKIDGEMIEIAGEKLPLQDNFEIQFQAKEGTLAESQNGIATILHTELTQELINEGIIRDIIRQVQELRKEMELQVNDRIYLYLNSEDETTNQAITNLADTIREETLADELQQSGNFEWDQNSKTKINEKYITIGIKKC
jgi:isoleucyl-tRNA synthetase